MARIVTTALVVALLASTAAAFALTEGFKLEPSPIRGTRVDKVFSPTCVCETDRAAISFRLRKGDRLRIAIVDGRGAVVRQLVDGQSFDAGRVAVLWNGRDDAGAVVPQGSYKPRVHLVRQRRTIVLPNPIRVDVTPPRARVLSVRPRVLSPDGDGRGDRVVVRYRLSEPARAILLVDGEQRALTHLQRTHDSVPWFGVADGKPLARGPHVLELRARDRAGNLGPSVAAGSVTIRYVALGRRRVDVRAGARFAVRVSADAPVTWRFGKRTGRARPGTLRLRAPALKGRYTLTVSVGSHSVRAAVFVREPVQ